MSELKLSSVIDNVEALAETAAETAMEIYKDNFDVQYKNGDRGSPLTEADRRAHRIIVAGLEEITPEVPIISEESDQNQQYSVRRSFDTFWLVDPLDGTKEFVNKNGEFTVNVGLIRNHIPVAGVVVAPVPNVTYRTDGTQSVVKDESGTRKLSSSETEALEDTTLLHSRSHSGEKMETLLETVDFKNTQPRGSSLKICEIADGSADAYVRFRPTWEWDTAAADAILRMSGGKFTEPDGNTITYNTKTLKNDRGLLVTNGRLHSVLSETIVNLFGNSAVTG